jgi:hypothetical protein
MKREIKRMGITLALIFFMAEEVFAADNVYIPISCTIPAIPGINTPIIDEAGGIQGEDNTSAKQEGPKETLSQIKEKIIPDELSLSQKNKLEQIFFLAEEKTPTGLLQTVYSR